MQILEIRSAGEHRILTRSDHAEPPPGLSEWTEALRPELPFQRVWADPALHGALVSEIVNGYVPPPAA